MFLNRKKRWIFNIIITVILLFFLIYKINPEELISTFKATNFFLLILSLPVVVALLFIRSVKWKILLKHLKIEIPLRESFRVVLIGIFYGMMTPGKAGELARAYYLKEKKAVVVPTVIWEKISDVLSLIILSCLAILLLFKNTELIYIVFIMTVILFMGLLAITNKKIVGLIARILKFSDKSKQYYLSSMAEMINPYLLIKIFFLSFLYYGITFILAAIVLMSLNPSLNLLLIFSLPIIILVGNAPITVSGLGLREFAAVIAFGAVEVNESYGFSFTMILFLLVTLLPALIGYQIIIRGRTNQQLNGILSGSLEKKRFNQIKRWLEGKNVLDIGCGTGSLFKIIPREMTYTGVDGQQEAIDEAKKLHKQATFIKLNIGVDKLKIKEKFDNIVLSAVLEHFEKPEKNLKELKKFLRKNGRVIITTPTNKAEKILKIGSKVGIFSISALKDHKQPLFTKHQLMLLVEKTDYKVIHYGKFELGLNQIIVLKNNTR